MLSDELWVFFAILSSSWFFYAIFGDIRSSGPDTSEIPLELSAALLLIGLPEISGLFSSEVFDSDVLSAEFS